MKTKKTTTPRLRDCKGRFVKRAQKPPAIRTERGDGVLDGRVVKQVGKAVPASPTTLVLPQDKPFRFLDLPGEIRNRIYHYTMQHKRQALVVHLPRRASLRRRKKTSPSHRPWVGLTQVSSQIRREYHPLYLLSQEIGLDLVDTQKYLDTFYPPDITNTASHVGNVTIAVADNVQELEKGEKGVNIWPLLDMWANSHRIEAGFGRYYRNRYVPEVDGEAKDLYRLFGRKVMEGRKCSSMNRLWRHILREKQLAEVRIHRKPANNAAPFLQILFKPEYKQDWMVDDGLAPTSQVPKEWKVNHGFGRMEHFGIKVGVLQTIKSELKSELKFEPED
ncbi:hypothetical protein BCR34DRAFT_230087 [Clohesyomyces aquaticus]|uniref:F-box domain-containing protein n=1 Tax=Clohesyomyces aquaticus TaxID=1231657 RepID=A0A1Y1Y7D5_9PLEO|nr:hypothetical protein BCR34DRAFT_230087 [Clohesyomyces aquaticus]